MWKWTINALAPSVLLAVLLTGSFGWGANQCELLLAFSNVENAIYSKYIPNEDIMDKKLEALADGIASLNNNKGPDFLGMAEISTPEVLKKLVTETKLKGLGYQTYITSGKPDHRGIDVGLISKLPLAAEPVAHVYWDANDPIWKHTDHGTIDAKDVTRPILEAKLKLPNGEIVTVFVNHWPSRHSGNWSVVRRTYAAKFLGDRVRTLLKEDPNANVVIMGDFNTVSYDVEMLGGVGVTEYNDGDEHKKPGEVFNLDDTFVNYRKEMREFFKQNPDPTRQQIKAKKDEIARKRGTYFYEKMNRWYDFDQIMVSSNMMKYYKKKSFHPVNRPPFADDEKKPDRFDIETEDGYSDHLPVEAAFVFDVDAEKQK